MKQFLSHKPNAAQRGPRTLAGIVAALALAAILGIGSLAPGTDAGQPGSTGAVVASSSTSEAAQSSQPGLKPGEAAYTFRTNRQLNEHYDKHGRDMGYSDAQAYQTGANAVIADPKSLHKLEREDNDDVYYLESTDELVIVSTDGYIRTYFKPGGIGYFNRQ